jgi:type II secretory pathway component PulC
LALLADAAHFLRIEPDAVPKAPQTPFHSFIARREAGIPRQILAAHLFGVDPSAVNAGSTQPPVLLTLNGVFASGNPRQGYAILGETGKPTGLYRTGDPINGPQTVRLERVYADRVVVDIDGLPQTIQLAHQRYGAIADVRDTQDADGSEQSAAGATDMGRIPSAAEIWFSALHADSADGGVQVYPEKRLQRTYGLNPGDTVAAVNGIPVRDSGALEAALRDSTGPMSVTFMHQGSPVTVELPQSN